VFTSAFITRFLHSRYAAIILAIIAVVGAWCVYLSGDLHAVTGDRGFALPSANMWIVQPWLSFLVNILGNLSIAALMILLNKHYNIIRSMTVLYAGLFLCMQLATPDLMAQMHTGTLLCFAIITCAMILYSCYSDTMSTRTAYTVFLILSLAAATQYCFLIFIPVFIIGCAQMRILNLRMIIAAVLGIITPWWILFGFNIITLPQLHLPEITSILSAIDLPEVFQMLITVAFTAFLMLASMLLNIFKTIAYNARTRAYFGLLNTISLITVVALVADYSNLTSYIPLLNCCAAFQVTHFFAIHARERAYIGLLSIIAVYIGFYIWRIAI
jgi:hypothetical protein